MAKVVLLEFLSLDGVAEEPSDWFFDDCPDLFELIGEVIGTQSDVLLGRGSYEHWVAARLVDDLRLVMPPTIAGHGKRLFTADREMDLQQFDLLDVQRTAKGTLFLHYRAANQ